MIEFSPTEYENLHYFDVIIVKRGINWFHKDNNMSITVQSFLMKPILDN